MSESVHREVVKLRQELNTLDTAFNEFKTMTNNRVEQISTSLKEIARTKVGTMICFRCHGYVLEHIQLQCGHIYCLH
ncbi:Oidioi.mRNA.OKI2018_I69.PAR.g8641.t1.cds [Oikopleura dioica]|uniref:Oidioi.mRNA.OKI2018_I69.PAR.g8641.t1.cds n=1 Tax=Oikopleura dioica TaxID=34765 RepID=A0ABN7RKH0_OIKDI|nr:Oidioi.mRNA.OKI2018_I69.PAR.g8641.t1.cds [Oikopleura dioica]